MSMIKIIFPDGNSREYERGVTPEAIAHSISPGLRKKSFGALINGEVYDLNRPINEEANIEIITSDDAKAFDILNHSAAHVLAEAIINLRPDAKIAFGPSTEEGFYYDVDLEPQFSHEDLTKLEQEMKKIVNAATEMIRREVSYEEAKEIFANNPYKLEIIEEVNAKGEQITIYEQGNFVDLCSGGLVGKTNLVKNFKLINLAGAYWRGDSNNKQLQRIYGHANFSKDLVEEYLQLLEERKERDHRKIGKELRIFDIDQETGQGLPLWLPNGYKVRKIIEDYIYNLEVSRGYQHISTPALGAKKLYEISGHWDHYQDGMFPVMEREGEEFVLRPMTCPHHMLVYKTDVRSYRDLPIRYAEFGLMHRYEASGALTGLQRVRAMTLNDSHIFCTPEQIKDEYKRAIDLIKLVIDKFDLEIDYIELALRDPENKEKYHDDDELWNNAEEMLREVLNELGIEYREEIGEAAFYGPKVDVQVKSAMGHTITMSTVQLDFLLPERFDLTYIGEDGKKHRPVVLHRGLVGTWERFMSILIEQTKGAFPYWLAPTQAVIIPVSNEVHIDKAQEVADKLLMSGIRVEIDNREEKMGYKIREWQTKKVPFQIIIGDEEVETNKISVRRYGSEKTLKMNPITVIQNGQQLYDQWEQIKEIKEQTGDCSCSGCSCE